MSMFTISFSPRDLSTMMEGSCINVDQLSAPESSSQRRPVARFARTVAGLG